MNGDLVEYKLQPLDDPDFIARRLTREFRRHFFGSGLGFNRRHIKEVMG
jgi:hypothetical protein